MSLRSIKWGNVLLTALVLLLPLLWLVLATYTNEELATRFRHPWLLPLVSVASIGILFRSVLAKWNLGIVTKLGFMLAGVLLIVAQIVGILYRAYFYMDLGTAQPHIESQSSWLQPLQAEWGLQSPGALHSVSVTREHTYLDADSLRFELRANEFYQDLFGKRSLRSEVNARDFPAMGSCRRYRFSILLPHDFPVEDNRLVLAQWHGADKKYLGERSRSPCLALRYASGRFFITLVHCTLRILKDSSEANSMVLYETQHFPHEQWHHFEVEAKWSYKDDGHVGIWWNGTKIVNYEGPVGYNDDFGPYFKFGIYRDATPETYQVYFSEVKISDCSVNQ